MRRSLLLIAFAVLLGGCVSVPESVQLPESTPLLPYEQINYQSDGSQGKMARWGGVIANVDNKSDKTVLDVIYHPLRNYGRPVLTKESPGRFRVYVDGFLDPMVYSQGRSITFAGEFSGIEEGLIGEHAYQYPTLQASGHHLWDEIDRVRIDTISVWPMHPFNRFAHPFGVRGGFYGWNGWGGWGGWGAWGWPQMTSHVVTRRVNPYRNFNFNQTGTRNRASGAGKASGSRSPGQKVSKTSYQNIAAVSQAVRTMHQRDGKQLP